MKRKYVLTFPPEATNEPVTFRLIRDFGLEINILRAEINAGHEGKLLLEIKSRKEELENGLKYLESRRIGYAPVSDEIIFHSEQCIHCGSCTAVCFSGALEMDPRSRNLLFCPEKCIACGLCTKACPLQLFTLEFAS
jgi:L-aspartate semialdehyde sulfurtransferase ferredoxin